MFYSAPFSTVRFSNQQGKSLDILDKLTGTVEAPEDWVVNHDHYLYSESYLKENLNNGERKNFWFIAD